MNKFIIKLLSVCFILFGAIFNSPCKTLDNQQELQKVTKIIFKKVGVIFDGGSLVFTFYVNDTKHKLLDVLMRDFAGEKNGDRYSISKKSRGIKGVWIEYTFYNEKEKVELKDYTLIDSGKADEEKIIELISLAGKDMSVSQREYIRIFTEIIKTRDTALKDMFYQIPYRSIFAE
ncbi:MAG: hypothetical protein LBK76_12025 [Verrucomicrobiales bacterium]|jgi:hypothetical protein|nr:hypothetical protein [Verrucomicrobiales bacterium]